MTIFMISRMILARFSFNSYMQSEEGFNSSNLVPRQVEAFCTLCSEFIDTVQSGYIDSVQSGFIDSLQSEYIDTVQSGYFDTI